MTTAVELDLTDLEEEFSKTSNDSGEIYHLGCACTPHLGFCGTYESGLLREQHGNRKICPECLVSQCRNCGCKQYAPCKLCWGDSDG